MVAKEVFQKLLEQAKKEQEILTIPNVGEDVASYENENTDETNKILLTQSPDDEGNAQCVNWLYRGKFLYCEALGWLYYNDKYWQRENVEALLDRAIIETLQNRRMLAVKAKKEALIAATKPSSHNVRNAKYLFKSLIHASVDDFDNNPDLLNCNNGVINLKDGFVTPHNEHQRFTYCIETPYDPHADDTEWHE